MDVVDQRDGAVAVDKPHGHGVRARMRRKDLRCVVLRPGDEAVGAVVVVGREVPDDVN